jgi:hypothetical protein
MESAKPCLNFGALNPSPRHGPDQSVRANFFLALLRWRVDMFQGFDGHKPSQGGLGPGEFVLLFLILSAALTLLGSG